jgi:argininosuccinate synthase
MCYYNPEPQTLVFSLFSLQGREDLLAYAKERAIPIAMGAGNKPPYSMDDNMFHISFESGVLEDPAVEVRLLLGNQPKIVCRCPPRPDFVDFKRNFWVD